MSSARAIKVMRTLPTGTLAFLFTDIEASSRLWEQYPESMRAALARHDELIERLVEQRHGVLVRPRGEGDSRFAVFPSVVAAALAALDVQRAFHSETWATREPLSVRMALHAGEADLRDGDYYGTVPNRCARLRALANGGQVLVSAVAAGLVGDELPEYVMLRDLGVHRLKDLTSPEHVFQLVSAGLPADFPPLRSLDVLPTNLPIQVTSFIGREPELAEVKRLLRATRLLTLMGAGGSGKTRLALQTAGDVLEEYDAGVWMVDLAPLTQPELVPHAVASALGVREEPGQPVLDTLANALRSRHLLLVLDNCEHLVAASAGLADRLLHACPRLQLLTTSREALAIAGETTWRVPPLRSVDPDHLPGVEKLIQFEAVRLFMERAASALPEFNVTNKNAPAVAQICHRLDGIPLAIELAAVRVKVLSPDQIARRLDDRFRLLTGGSRTGLPRQQTLRALVDWSYDLLTEQETALFRRLSVFAGGWSLEAAEAVCVGRPIDPGVVLDQLTALVDKSLVLADEHLNGEMRYRLLETLRAYAAERLVEAGERDEMLQRHAEYFVGEVERLDELRKHDWRRWRSTAWPWLYAEEDNLRTLLGRCRDGSVDASGQAEIGLRLCGGTWWFRSLHARLNEAWDWHKSLLAVTPRRVSVARFYATWFLGITTGTMIRFEESEPLLTEARAMAHELADDQMVAVADGASGEDYLWQGRLSEAEEFNERGLALARRVGPACYMPIFLYNAGWTALRQGRLERATELLDEAIVSASDIGDDPILSLVLPLRASVSLLRKDLAGARAYLERADALARDLPIMGMGFAALGLGQLALLEDDTGEAATRFLVVLEFAGRTGGRLLMAESLDGLAFVAAKRGDASSAVRLLASVDSLRAAMNQGRPPEDQRRVDATLARLRLALGDVDYNAAWTAGRDNTLEVAVQLGRRLGSPGSAAAAAART